MFPLVNSIYEADCISLLERLPSNQIHLIYIDPPWPKLGDTYSLEPYDLKAFFGIMSRALQQCQRILHEQGNIFFHSPPIMSGSVRLWLEQIFGRHSYRAEIVVPNARSFSEPDQALSTHDTILYFSKSDTFTFNPQFRPAHPNAYTLSDKYGPYRFADLTRPISTSSRYSWRGYTPPPGRSWRYSQARMEEMLANGQIVIGGGLPRQKMYLSEASGPEIGSIWDDISPHLPAREDLHYTGQKRVSLLDRIVCMGSNEGEIVLDPFCGTGTTLISAQHHKRVWLACDISPTAHSKTLERLSSELGLIQGRDFFLGTAVDLQQHPPERATYRRIKSGFEDLLEEHENTFALGQKVLLEETRHCEFKEVRGTNPIEAIKNTADEYVVAFLNSEGGRIFWGIRDDRVVVGVPLDSGDRDKLRRVVTEKLNAIRPAIDPTQYRIEFHKIPGLTGLQQDLYVIEIVVPEVLITDPYFTGGNDMFVRTDSGKKNLSGPEIVDWLRRRWRG